MSLGLPLVLALILPSLTVEQVPNPRARNSWVADEGNVLSPEDEQRLNTIITNVEARTGVEIAVVTVPNVDGTPKDFAGQLFRAWGIGKQKADNGLLVLLVLGQRRLEMETGYGLEPVLPDGWLGVMQSQHMVPHFKAGRFDLGLVAGVEQVQTQILANETEAREGSRRQGVKPRAAARGAPTFLVPVAGSVALMALFLAVWVVRSKRRAARQCQKCGAQARILPEDKEDKFLTKGQQHEEELGSILYDVLFCDRCGAHRVVSHNRVQSGYFSCTKCRNKTVESRSRTVRSADYDAEGLMETTFTCKHCKHSYVQERTTARLVRPEEVAAAAVTSSWFSGSGDSSSSWTSNDSSSSSWGSSDSGSSGGSDFGGGDSGGGGSGSDY